MCLYVRRSRARTGGVHPEARPGGVLWTLDGVPPPSTLSGRARAGGAGWIMSALHSRITSKAPPRSWPGRRGCKKGRVHHESNPPRYASLVRARSGAPERHFSRPWGPL